MVMRAEDAQKEGVSITQSARLMGVTRSRLPLQTIWNDSSPHGSISTPMNSPHAALDYTTPAEALTAGTY